MKKVFIAAALAAMIVSCGSKGNKSAEIIAESESDSIFAVNDSTLGELQTYSYEGILPAADAEGINYQLTLHAVVYYSVPVVCSLPAEYCDSAVRRFRDILRSAACHAGSFLRIGILGILPVYETDKKQVALYPLLLFIYECQCAERHPLSQEEKRKRSLGKGKAR